MSLFFYRQRRHRAGDVDIDIDIPDIDVEQEMKNVRRRLPIFGLVALAMILVFLAQALPAFVTDWQWFKSLGQGDVFTKRISARIGLFLGAVAVFFVLYMINVLIARRLSAKGMSNSRAVLTLAIFMGLTLAAFFGLIVQAQWETILRYQNATPFGITDPVFSQDLSFYVFNLPVYVLAQSLLSMMTVVIAIAVVIIYALSLGKFRLTPAVKAHMSALGAIFLLLFAWNYRISIYNMVYSSRGVVYGPSFTDVHYQWPAYNILIVLTILAAIILLANIFVRATKWLAITAGAWLVVTILLAQVFPQAMQSLVVKPNELTREAPYIENNIRLTRTAFGLDTIREENFPGAGSPTAADIAKNANTVANIRLWDYRPLLDTYDQLQSIRPYYDFHDIDIDRYMLGGKYTQVMLSARTMIQSKLPVQAQTWINQKLVYTHGYGAAMSPANAILPDGSPDFVVRNIPPMGEIKTEQPGIYFDDKMEGYVIVRTKTREFDYPLGDQTAETIYSGSDGVNTGSLFSRILFALRYGDANFILSNAIVSESRVLMYRNIQQRISLLAPFLALDNDPYIVMADGKLYWIQDAYTLTSRYPISQMHIGGFNYIRNSVKVVIDAYDGRPVFYIVDEKDPLIAAWQGIFPSLFTPFSEMPASLREHVRYPQDIFQAQAEMLRTYHMTDVREFYNKEDQWAMPKEVYGDREQLMEPYYTVMKLPDGNSEEFILLLPFTPNNKQNMVAWLGAKSDGEAYGERVLYEMPRDYLVYGPQQIEARISQDTSVSAQVTLWSQSGSKVTRGNMMVIPIEKSFLYVEPLYLLADQSQIPQLKRVIVATATSVAMEENLGLALAKIYGAPSLATGAPATGTPAPGTPPASATPVPLPGDIPSLISLANQQYEQAQEALRLGDWAKYGEAQKNLESTLKRLSQLAGVR